LDPHGARRFVPLIVKDYFSVRRFHSGSLTVKAADATLRAQLAVIDRCIRWAAPYEITLLEEYRRWFAGRIWWRAIGRHWNLEYAMPLVAGIRALSPYKRPRAFSSR
jgi:hypothetical protein